jgi:excinuclease ABC subunit C
MEIKEFIFEKENIDFLPSLPGCYLFKDKDKNIIYVGKAKNLKKRIKSYFINTFDRKTMNLIVFIKFISLIETISEKAALILELNLIKFHKPRFNVLLTDDRSFPYICITNEENPTYKIIRKVNFNFYLNKKKFIKYYGPFPDGTGAFEILKILERIFPLRRCNSFLSKACFYYMIEQCSGSCFKNISFKEYKKKIKNIDNFFNQKSHLIVNIINKKIAFFQKKLQFENAQKYKDLLEKIELFIQKQDVDITSKKNFDFLGIKEEENKLAVVIFFYRFGKLQRKEKDYFLIYENINDAIRTYLQQIYSYNLQPDYLYLNEVINKNLLKKIFPKIKFISPKKGIKKSILEKTEETAKEIIFEKLTYEKQGDPISMLKNKLKLKNLNYFEIFDISNLQGTNIIGAVLKFQVGTTNYSKSKIYKLNENNNSDIYWISETINKHYQEKVLNKKSLPDLIIIDGGISQQKIAKATLKKLNLNIPVIALFKNKKHKTEGLITNQSKKIILKKDGPLFLFLSSIQEKIHFLAINAFKKSYNKNTLNSILEKIKGIGKKRKEKLLTHFTDFNNLNEDSFEIVNQVIKNKKITNLFLEKLISLKKEK